MPKCTLCGKCIRFVSDGCELLGFERVHRHCQKETERLAQRLHSAACTLIAQSNGAKAEPEAVAQGTRKSKELCMPFTNRDRVQPPRP
jgi:hypothetical protein